MLAPYEHYSSTPMPMEVDRDCAGNVNASAHAPAGTPPPPRRAGRTKRARSPPSSPGAHEPPAKRLLAYRVPGHSSPNARCARTPHVAAPRHAEDWVSRTQGLSIAKDETGCAGSASGDADERMTIDNEEGAHQPSPPPDPPMRFPADPCVQSYHPADPLAVVSPQAQYPQAPPQSTSPSLPSIPAPAPVSMFAHAHSPSQEISRMQEPASSTLGADFFSLDLPISDPDMYISASQSASLPPVPPTPRKQRFTMGPRADCEKCRLGVPGHWMHFD